MSYAPFRENTRVYKGTTFGFSFTIDEDGSPLDLTTLNKVEAKLFSSSTNIFTFDTDGDLSISGASNNVISGVASESTMDIAKRIYYLELWLYFSDGSKEAYSVIDVKIIDAESDESQGAHDWELDIDNDSETVTGQATSNLAEAIQAKEDAETAETGAQTAESGAVSAKNDAETAESNAETSATNAATSETNAANSATESQNNADDAEKQAQNTTSFTDSDGNSFDKGAKGYANDAETSANNAEATAEQEAQQRVIDAHGYYSKRFSNLEERIRDLENA